jgi:hypothetical protein
MPDQQSGWVVEGDQTRAEISPSTFCLMRYFTPYTSGSKRKLKSAGAKIGYNDGLSRLQACSISAAASKQASRIRLLLRRQDVGVDVSQVRGRMGQREIQEVTHPGDQGEAQEAGFRPPARGDSGTCFERDQNRYVIRGQVYDSFSSRGCEIGCMPDPIDALEWIVCGPGEAIALTGFAP